MTRSAGGPPTDLRAFGPRAAFDDVLALIDSRATPLPGEAVAPVGAAGRVLAEPVVSDVDVPAFPRAAMDGFAVRAADTAGATDAHPRALKLLGAAFPGRPFGGAVGAAQAVRVTTGAPVPPGADAVLMVEFAHIDSPERVSAYAAVAPGKHVARIGEDVARGCEVLPVGRVLRPQDVGLLASIGVSSVRVVRRPRVAILVTGNELLPPGARPEGFRIVDSNSPVLAALATRDGAEVLPARYLPDDYAAVRDALRDTEADIILLSGGTSVGSEDHAARAAAAVGELAVHGIAVRPAGPTGVAFLPRAFGFLLPGNPVACLCAYDLFAARAVRRLGGRAAELPYRRLRVLLAEGIVSAPGRVDYVRVAVRDGKASPLATGGASNLSSVVNADGFVLVPAACDALQAGEEVEVWLYDAW